MIWRVCLPDERRVTCVVDGDTLWYHGTKIRLIGIDTPEIEGRCAAERQIAAQATRYLTNLLNTGLRKIAFDGEDRYGRALARLWVTEGEVGPAMLAAGLAEPFPRREPPPWCG
ncbi:MAG: thermonuclease family protein [Paracoccaceae bacterium]